MLSGQTVAPIHIDASQPFVEPGPAAYQEGTATSPGGLTLGVNSRYLMLNGKPWLPVMGEFHFSRYPRAQWENEILKMKAAGVNIVATYVIWIHHEEIEDQFDWSGQRDLRAFVQLCAQHGLYVEPRIGPWDHAEVRNGGLPDWVIKQGPTRENDPAYLKSVRVWYGQIAEQLKGLLWKDGGPVIGIQLENEYSKRGPNAGEAHILELKKTAIESGLDVPLYFVTGWDNAVVPRGAVIPIYGGGYPDAPWDGSIHKLPPGEVYAFRYQNRVTANVNVGDVGAAIKQSHPWDDLPYLTAETGGGVEDTYHRRPVIRPDDIGAMFPVMLGSGVNLYGTYMFQGGQNPDGKLTTLQESQATGYPNDLPIKSYDFQAPLGEFGQERESFRKLKVFEYFVNDFGADLAPMMVHAPDQTPKNAEDLSVPRASVRSKGDAGFIFLNNYVRNYAMPARPATQFLIRLPAEAGHNERTLAVPQHPVDIPSGAYFIWPFNLRVDGITIRYSTAQLFTRLDDADKPTLYFEAISGIPVEFAFEAASVKSMHASSGEQEISSGVLYLKGLALGAESSIDLVAHEGRSIRIVVLTAREAENAWKIRIDGAEHLLFTDADFFAGSSSGSSRIWLQSRGSTHFEFALTPPLSAPLNTSLPLRRVAKNDRIERFTADASTRDIHIGVQKMQPAGKVPSVKIGPMPNWRPNGVAQAPAETELPQAAQWSITIPPGSMNGLSNVFLEIRYLGDLARFYTNHRLLDDDFYNGLPWSIGLNSFLDARDGGNFKLSVLPLRSDAPVYFELPQELLFPLSGQVSELESVRAVPEYQLVLSAGR
ncbi:MAG TPA: beta-galactosidase [Terracidiphilus sp.]|nr:beta-galactosidase [Terracidiphilus sp.]